MIYLPFYPHKFRALLQAISCFHNFVNLLNLKKNLVNMVLMSVTENIKKSDFSPNLNNLSYSNNVLEVCPPTSTLY